jgi:hypothetical protein
MLRVAFIAFCVCVATQGEAAEPPKTIKLEVKTPEEVKPYVHYFLIDFQSDPAERVAKVRHIFFTSNIELTLRAEKPVLVSTDEMSGDLFMFTFVNETPAKEGLSTISLFYSPGDGKAVGVASFFEMPRSSVSGGNR